MWQFVIRQEGGRCIEFCVSAASGWSFVTKLDDVFRNLDFELEVSCSSNILICLLVFLSLTADSTLVRQLDHVRFLSNPSQLTMYPSPYHRLLTDGRWKHRRLGPRCSRHSKTRICPQIVPGCNFGLPLPLSQLLLFMFVSFRHSNADGTQQQMIHIVLQF